jgi:hypothetical protein
MSIVGTKQTFALTRRVSASDPKRTFADFVTCGELRLGGRASGYSPDWMALSSRKRIAPSLLLSEITKRTRPCLAASSPDKYVPCSQTKLRSLSRHYLSERAPSDVAV